MLSMVPCVPAHLIPILNILLVTPIFPHLRDEGSAFREVKVLRTEVQSKRERVLNTGNGTLWQETNKQKPTGGSDPKVVSLMNSVNLGSAWKPYNSFHY